jgi:hypothetical protein
MKFAGWDEYLASAEPDGVDASFIDQPVDGVQADALLELQVQLPR